MDIDDTYCFCTYYLVVFLIIFVASWSLCCFCRQFVLFFQFLLQYWHWHASNDCVVLTCLCQVRVKNGAYKSFAIVNAPIINRHTMPAVPQIGMYTEIYTSLWYNSLFIFITQTYQFFKLKVLLSVILPSIWCILIVSDIKVSITFFAFVSATTSTNYKTIYL